MIDTAKIIRLFIGAFMFLCVLSVTGMDTREAHQFTFVLVNMVLFSLLLKNLWLTLFMCWTVLLFSFFKFNHGHTYIYNMFFGCILYYLTKLSFKKDHIDWFFKIFLWVVAINLIYGIIQVLGYDFIYSGRESLPKGFMVDTLGVPAPIGFFGNTNVTAMLYMFAMPIVATRQNKWSYWLAYLFLIPLYFLHSSSSIITAIILMLFVSYFKFSKKVFIAIIAGLMVVLGAFVMFCDKPTGNERFEVWRMILSDSKIHPISGWGLDSFREFTEKKNHIYGFKINGENIVFDKWDNPHNLYLSLCFEFGFISWFLLVGYWRDLYIRFKRSLKSSNMIALTSFVIGFFIVSIGQFPMFLARFAVILIPVFALYEVETNG